MAPLLELIMELIFIVLKKIKIHMPLLDRQNTQILYYYSLYFIPFLVLSYFSEN